MERCRAVELYSALQRSTLYKILYTLPQVVAPRWTLRVRRGATGSPQKRSIQLIDGSDWHYIYKSKRHGQK